MQQLKRSSLTVITGETTAHKLEGREEGACPWNSAALPPSPIEKLPGCVKHGAPAPRSCRKQWTQAKQRLSGAVQTSESKQVKSIVTHPGWTNKTVALEGLSCF